MLAAQDEARVQNVGEQRNVRDVAALSSQYNVANQAENQAIGNAIGQLGSAASGVQDYYSPENIAKRKNARLLKNQ